jgi:hypothetical protein
MFKRFFSSLVLVATVALYGCGGGGGGGTTPSTLVQLSSITVSPANPSITVGALQQFTALGTYTDNSTQDLTATVTWSSSDTSKATIAATGVATAVAAGATTITATDIASGKTNSTTLTVTASLSVSTLAGLSGTSGSANGNGSAARFNNPNGITTDGTSLYVADTNNKSIRKITAAGDVTTITSALGLGPYGITRDGDNLYVAESLTNTIRKIVISTGAVTTIAGSGTAGHVNSTTGIAAQFDQPMDITTDGTNLYVADYNNGWIRKIVIASGEVSNFAQVVHPRGITMDAVNLYVTSDTLQVIIKIEIFTGTQTIVAGTLSATGSTNGTGSAARFNKPIAITTDGPNLYVADSLNFSIRKIEISTGKVTTVVTQSNSIQPLGITLLGNILYTTNNDQTIKVLQ